MNKGLREDRVRGLIEACRDYWSRNGVPEARISEMSVELGDHLNEALAEGKSVEDVVGPDVEEFAEAWAVPNRPARSLGEETLDAVSDAVFALAVVGVLGHLALWSSSIPFSATDTIATLLLALLLVRLFAYLRAPSDAPPGSEESVLDRYPKRAYNVFMWSLVAVYAVVLFVPFPETILFRWPVQATLVLPLVAALTRETKRLLAGNGEPAGPPPELERSRQAEDPAYQRIGAVVDCSFYWSKMRIPEDQVDDMRRGLDEHVGQALEEGRSVRPVIGDDVEAFAEAWAEEHGAEPEFSLEPLRHVVQGWILSFSACATALATFAHLREWSLRVPVVWVLGIYLLLVALWFAQPVADLLERLKSWRYSPWKSMLAAGMIVVLIAAVSTVMALLFVVVGPRIPFEWPWYATVVCALVASSIVAWWLRSFSREDAERERRRTGQG